MKHSYTVGCECSRCARELVRRTAQSAADPRARHAKPVARRRTPTRKPTWGIAGMGRDTRRRSWRFTGLLTEATPDFRSCAMFALGLVRVGVDVTTMGCNQAGDVTDRKWTGDLDSLPFCEQFQRIEG